MAFASAEQWAEQWGGSRAEMMGGNWAVGMAARKARPSAEKKGDRKAVCWECYWAAW
jgi:hypothetical protein